MCQSVKKENRNNDSHLINTLFDSFKEEKMSTNDQEIPLYLTALKRKK